MRVRGDVDTCLKMIEANAGSMVSKTTANTRARMVEKMRDRPNALSRCGLKGQSMHDEW
jgi:hypothetical protein